MKQILEWMEEHGTPANPFLLFLLFFVFVLCLIKFKHGATKYKLPPSPTKLPFIGNLHQLHGPPHRALLSLAKKHGPLMSIHLGLVPTVVVSSANVARDVLKTYDHVFSTRPEFMIAKRLLYGKDILFSPYGEYWRQVRKICVLQLLSVKKVESFRFVREEEIVLLMEKIQEYSLAASALNLSEMFVSLTFNITCRVALGRKYSEDDAGGRNFKELFKEFTCLLGASNVEDSIPSLGWVNHLNGLYARIDTNFRQFDTFLDEVVKEHIEKKKSSRAVGGSGEIEIEEDFVDVMLETEKDSTIGIRIERDHSKAVIMDMFAAGTDTSTVVLEWAMSELLRHPEIMKEVQNELRAIAKGKLILKETDTKEMHYLRAVIKETLRLHPPAPLLAPHLAMEDVKLQGYDVPAKTVVMVNVYAIGRDPLLWEEAEKFWPERFLNGASSVDFMGQDFQFIPFGAGRRGCPGIHFATSAIELALANVLNRFDWALPNGMDGKDLDMLEHTGTSIHRENDLVVTAKLHYCY